MRRTGVIALASTGVLAAGVLTGGVFAVAQELDVDDAPGDVLTLEGVETGAAAAAGALTGSRVRVEGSTPKVDESASTGKTVAEVAPPDPVQLAPRTAPATKPAGPKADSKKFGHTFTEAKRGSGPGPWGAGKGPGDDSRRGDDGDKRRGGDDGDDRRGPGGHKGPGGGGDRHGHH